MHIRKSIRQLKPYKPGRPLRDLEALGIQEGVKLGSNENPYPPSPKVIEAIQNAAQQVRLYPEPGAPDLREALAAHHGRRPNEVIAGAGIDDLLDLTVRVMLDPGDNLVLAEPGFVRYSVAAGSAAGEVKKIPGTDDAPYAHNLDAMLRAIDERTRIVVLVNPNNPTGSRFTNPELEDFLARVPENVLTILDEAYFEFVDDPDYPNGMNYLDGGKPLLVFRTFSKCHSLAGLRVGYGVGPVECLEHLDRARLPFNINSLAQAAALAAISDTDHIERTRTLAGQEVKFLTEGLRRLGFRVEPSWTNFVFAEAPVEGGPLAEELMRKGFILRPLTGFGLPDRFFRISHGTREQDQGFLEAMEQVLKVTP